MSYLIYFLSIFYLFCLQTNQCLKLRDEKNFHQAANLTNSQLMKLTELSDINHINNVLDHILITRVVGSEGHEYVKDYILEELEKLDWSVERDIFEDKAPILGNLQFENIVARLNPHAKRYLVFACHYDSKYTPNEVFIGATDSAVPCAMMLNIITVMKPLLDKIKHRNDVSLKLIFFDGEEAFHSWGPKDSIYGARHLAKKWHRTKYPKDSKEDTTELDRMDMIVLLDLLGAPDPQFYSYFHATQKWYGHLVNVESRLSLLGLLNRYSTGQPEQRYFRPKSVFAQIEDDHIPFMQRGVPILHIIPHPFPKVWHTMYDNRDVIDLNTVENLNKIFRVYIAEYLNISV